MKLSLTMRSTVSVWPPPCMCSGLHASRRSGGAAPAPPAAASLPPIAAAATALLPFAAATPLLGPVAGPEGRDQQCSAPRRPPVTMQLPSGCTDCDVGFTRFQNSFK